MMEQDWNHPSVIAWSIGNEYDSYTNDGINWTRDMRAFSLDLDLTRLITFASRLHRRLSSKPVKPKGASTPILFRAISIGTTGRVSSRARTLAGQAGLVTGFGKMGETGEHNPTRIEDITEAVVAMKARPYMVGGSLWTWADYRSLYRGAPASGVRNWGVVNVEREHRDSWVAVQKLFATELP